MRERRRRAFPETFKREAVGRVRTSGLPIVRIAEELGLHETFETDGEQVEAAEQVCRATLAIGTSFGIELVDQIDPLKNRPRTPLRMQARAMLRARCDLPVPVPPISTTSRCSSMEN